jgi:hypothetical protein
MQIGTSIEGAYNACPPPEISGFGFKKIKRLAKKTGRGLKKAGKVAVKAHTMPLKVAAKAGKFAAKQIAKVASLPIRLVFKKLAARRGKYLAYQRSGKAVMNAADRKAASAWAIAKVRKAGPIGVLAVKILQFTGGATVGTSRPIQTNLSASMTGMTGAEIAAAAATIVATLGKLMSALNKKGEAPANPAEGSAPEGTQTVQPVIESDDSQTERPGQSEEAEQPEETEQTE